MRILSLKLAFLALLVALPATAGAHGKAGDMTRAGSTGFLTHGADLAPRRSARAAVMARTAQASQTAAQWCGETRTTDDTVNESNRDPFRFHAIYAVPSDAQPRLEAVAGGLQADARQANNLFAARFGRAIRFDTGTSCGAQYLDITTLRLPVDTQTLTRLAATPSGVIDVVAKALDAAGLPTAELGETPTGQAARTNYLVWLDGPEPEDYCGQATLSLDRRRSADNENNFGGKVAAIFRDGDGFCGASTVLHEIGHTLGAVQPRTSDDNGWTGHCSDEGEDIMCDASAPALAGPDAARDRLDSANDDYWDPPSGQPLGWWTLNLSRFICPDASCKLASPAAKKSPRASKSRSKKRRAANSKRKRATGAAERRRAAAARGR